MVLQVSLGGKSSLTILMSALERLIAPVQCFVYSQVLALAECPSATREAATKWLSAGVGVHMRLQPRLSRVDLLTPKVWAWE